MSAWYHVVPSSLRAFASTLNHLSFEASHLSDVSGHLPMYVVSGPTAACQRHARAGRGDGLSCGHADIWNWTSLPALTCAMPPVAGGLPTPHAMSGELTSLTGPFAARE